MPADFVPLSDARAQLGESPVWSSVHQAVWWVDIIGRKLLQTMLTGATESWNTPEIPGFVQCLGSTVYVGMQSGIYHFDAATGKYAKVASLEAEVQRFNEASQDSQGRIWAGTMDL